MPPLSLESFASALQSDEEISVDSFDGEKYASYSERLKPLGKRTQRSPNKSPPVSKKNREVSNNVVDESFAASAHSSLTSTTSLLGPFTRIPNRLTPARTSSTKMVDIVDLVSPAPLATVGSVKTKSVITKLDAPSRHCVLKLPKRQSRYLNESSEDSSDDDSAANN
jgi:hypothetical protein